MSDFSSPHNAVPAPGVAAIIVAAGSGTRAGGAAPKQYRPIGGRCAVERCLTLLAAHQGVSIVLTAIRAEDRSRFEKAKERALSSLSAEEGRKIAEPILGGAERQETVRLALEHLADKRFSGAEPPELVAIHDAARPFLPPGTLDRAIEAARRFGGACVAEPLVDTLRTGETGHDAVVAGEITPREGLWRAQTPQVFAFRPILEAHRAQAGRPATDDAEIARRAGLTVALTQGAPELMKITRPEDFVFAEAWALWEDRMKTAAASDIRVGQGFDVHRFGPNADGSSDHVMLCGVRVPHRIGLSGHSDADVGLHALTDAVLGAAALGDIGRHFPPSDEKWRGASSDLFLAHALKLAREAGGRPTLLDVTLICERPKIGPHAEAMRARIAEIAEMEIARVSVKATTTEGLGFTGRGEGIAAMASATLVFSG